MDSSTAAPELNNDFSTLGIIDFYIVPHCTNFPFKKPAEKIITEYSEKLDLRPIHNKQTIIVKGNQVGTIEVKSNVSRRFTYLVAKTPRFVSVLPRLVSKKISTFLLRVLLPRNF